MPKQVKVYSTPTCSWCKLTKQLLEKNNVAYVNIDVTADKASREEMVSRTGQMSVPVIEIDGELSIGYNESWLKQKLNIPRCRRG